MSKLEDTLRSIAPTVATALLGPLGGAAIAAIGSILGISQPSQQALTEAITSGMLAPDQLSELKKLELQYQNDEQERGFKYADLAFRDRDSARKASVEGSTQKSLFWLSLMLLLLSLGTEIVVLFSGYPTTIPEIVVGRVLGLMDAVAMMVLAYWYGTTNGSAQKNQLLADAEPSQK